MSYTIRGTYYDATTDEGDAFDLPGYFPTMADAMAYATTYAHALSGTDQVFADHAEGWVRAVGDTYSETLRVEG